jgi:cytochrome c-type biogenesis protein CcsB
MGLEVRYNRWAPFRLAWICTLLAFLCLLLSMGTGWKSLYAAGWLAFANALVAMTAGFGLRIAISGRAPVTNMYESVIYLSLGVAVLGLVFELIYRRRFILTAATAVATIALVLADNCPAALDPSLRPLEPVLRSNFWLVTHVMTITLSYAAFALALGIGNITLGYYLARSESEATINGLTNFTHRSLQVGVLLLAAGTILGGIWADYSWGRFWGWDPKEVWALIALLGYVAVLHARFAGWVRRFGLAVLSVLCFALVVMAWYGVNFVLGAGLHSYGFGGGGQGYVCTALGVQVLFVVATILRSGKWRGLASYDPFLPRVEEKPAGLRSSHRPPVASGG